MYLSDLIQLPKTDKYSSWQRRQWNEETIQFFTEYMSHMRTYQYPKYLRLETMRMWEHTPILK